MVCTVLFLLCADKEKQNEKEENSSPEKLSRPNLRCAPRHCLNFPNLLRYGHGKFRAAMPTVLADNFDDDAKTFASRKNGLNLIQYSMFQEEL
jgi:hypothetical protein